MLITDPPLLKFLSQILPRVEEKYIILVHKIEYVEELMTPSFLTRYNLYGKQKIINL
jgi:hypothetical protein